MRHAWWDMVLETHESHTHMSHDLLRHMSLIHTCLMTHLSWDTSRWHASCNRPTRRCIASVWSTRKSHTTPVRAMSHESQAPGHETHEYNKCRWYVHVHESFICIWHVRGYVHEYSKCCLNVHVYMLLSMFMCTWVVNLCGVCEQDTCYSSRVTNVSFTHRNESMCFVDMYIRVEITSVSK